MADSCGWIFVDRVPLLYDRKKVARQLQVETWLSLSQLVEELKIEDLGQNKGKVQPETGYII